MMRLGFAYAVFALGLILPDTAMACACCADPGYRIDHTHETDDWHAAQIETLEFDRVAHLYSDACGDECIAGIEDPKSSYQIDVARDGAEWRINLSHEGASEGQLHFSMPARYAHFATDLAPDPTNVSPVPYSEYRHQVMIAGTESFSAKGEMFAAELVFAGQSLSLCDDLMMSTHWYLDVDGPAIRWRLYGRLLPDGS